ncbi:MAG: hypothetical protein FWH10_04240 [Oscillospiraceae bacterium]|nr:hypothetical protein [Oscillospiraceae bacterium]
MTITKKIRAMAFMLTFLTAFCIFASIPSPVIASESEEDIIEETTSVPESGDTNTETETDEEETDGEEFEDYEDYEEEEIEEELDEETLRLMRIEELEELIDEAQWKVIAVEYILKPLEQEIYNHRYEERRVPINEWGSLLGPTKIIVVERKGELLANFLKYISDPRGILSFQYYVSDYANRAQLVSSLHAIEGFYERDAYYLELETELYEQLFLILGWEYELLELQEASEYARLLKEIELTKAELLYLQTKTTHIKDMFEYNQRTVAAINSAMTYVLPEWEGYILNPDDPYYSFMRSARAEDYLVTYQLYEEDRVEYLEQIIEADVDERIREIEEYLEGPIVKKALYAQILDLRNLYREIEAEFQEELDTGSAGWILYNRSASDLLSTWYINTFLENKFVEYNQGPSPFSGESRETYALYAEGFSRLIALMGKLDEYTDQMIELTEEYFKEYLEVINDYWGRHRFDRSFVIDTYEGYYPFLSFDESDYLYWFLDWDFEKAKAWGSRSTGGGLWIVNQPVLDSFKVSLEGLERYLIAWAVRKAESGETLSATELYWYRLWRSRTDVSVGKVSEEEFFGTLPYYLIVGALSLIETLMGFFEIAAGTKNISYNGKPMKLFDAFFLNPAVSYAFWGITVISLALLIFVAIGSISKHAMNLNSGKSIGATLGQIGRSALAFLLAPIVMLSSMHIVAAVMEQTDRAFDIGSGASSVTRSVFVMTTLEAGHGEVIGSMQSPVRQKFLSGQYDYKNKDTAAKYFRLDELDLLLAMLLAGVLIFMYIGLICIFILRLFYILLLYLACPLFIPSLAAGEGSMFKKWRDLFISKLITGFGLIVSVKLVTYIMPVVLLGDFKLGPEGFGDLMVKFIFVIGSVFAVAKSSGIIGKMVYPEGDSTEDMVLGAMKDKLIYVAKKVKEAVEKAIKSAINMARLLIMGDASGMVSQIKEEADKKAKKTAETVSKIAQSATQGGGKDKA